MCESWIHYSESVGPVMVSRGFFIMNDIYCPLHCKLTLALSFTSTYLVTLSLVMSKVIDLSGQSSSEVLSNVSVVVCYVRVIYIV